VIPFAIWICDNCGYRFVKYGKDPGATADPDVQAGGLRRKLLKFGFPVALVIVALAGFLFISRSFDTEQQGQDFSVPKVVKKPAIREPMEKLPVIQPAAKPVVEIPLIIMGDSNMFGVNWSGVSEGVQIKALADGPFKTAGIKMGDILLRVAERKVTSAGGELLQVREEIFQGRRNDAIIDVLRAEQVLQFRLVRKKIVQEPNLPEPRIDAQKNETKSNLDKR